MILDSHLVTFFFSLPTTSQLPGEPPVAGNLPPSCDKDANVVAQPCAVKETRRDEVTPGRYQSKTLPGITLPETNMAPENRPLEKEIPIGNHHFLEAMLVSGRVGLIGGLFSLFSEGALGRLTSRDYVCSFLMVEEKKKYSPNCGEFPSMVESKKRFNRIFRILCIYIYTCVYIDIDIDILREGDRQTSNSLMTLVWIRVRTFLWEGLF